MLNNYFISVTEAMLISAIESAKSTIYFIGAGISENMANQFITKKDIVKFIALDNNDDVYQIGYGHPHALRIIKEAGISIKSSGNIRINVLTVDDKAIVYSPTPLVIEDEPKNQSPNGLLINFSSISHLFNNIEIGKTQLSSAKEIQANNSVQGITYLSSPTSNVSKSEDNHTRFETFNKVEHNVAIPKFETLHIAPASMNFAEIPEQEIKKTEDNAKANPPQLDLKRKLKTYQSKIQFIEIHLVGFSVKQHTVKIPNDLLLVAHNDEAVQNQLNATYSLFNNDSQAIVETKRIQDMVKQLRKDFIISLPGYGTMFLKTHKNELTTRINSITSEITKSKETIKNQLAKDINASKERLASVLFQTVKNNPPKALTYVIDGQPTDEQIKAFVNDALNGVFVTVDDLLNDMKIDVVYKDVTLETLQDKAFSEAVMNSRWKYNFLDQEYVTYNNVVSEK